MTRWLPWILLVVFLVQCGVICYLAAVHGDDKAENTELRMAANRRLRSSSGMTLPGFTAEYLERITRTADNFGTPYLIPATVYQVENGGDFLEVGIQALPWFVAKHIKSAKDQQFAALCVQINEEMGKYILADPVRTSEFWDLYAQRHNDVGKGDYRYELAETFDRFKSAAEPADLIKPPKRAGKQERPKDSKHRKRRKR